MAKIDHKKYEPFVVFPDKGPLIDLVEALGINTYMVHKTTLINRHIKNRMLRFISKLYRDIFRGSMYFMKLYMFICDKKPDLIYVNTKNKATPIILAKILGINVLVHVRGFFKMPDGLYKASSKARIYAISKYSDKFICVSKAVKQSLLDKGFSSRKVSVVYNGVDLDEFKPSRQTRRMIRLKLGLNDEETLVGFVGRINSIKGIEDFIIAMSTVHEKKKNCKFIVIGGPTDSLFFKSKILPLCNRLNLENYIIFTGFQDDVTQYLSAIDIFVNTSIMEPFGRVLIEAMAMEKPVIATNAGGNPEVVIEGRTGFLIPVGDSQSLANKILELIKDRKLMIKFGKAGRKRVELNFNSDYYYGNIEREIAQIFNA